jgi:predicted porin
MGGTPMGISGLSRANAISYTTPTIAGFSFQAAWGEQDAVDDGSWDVALRYAGEFSGFRVAAAVSYGKNIGGTTDAEDVPITGTQPFFGNGADIRKWQGSASVLHVASGLFLSGSYARQSYHGTTIGELNQFTDGGLVTGEHRPDTTFWYLLGGITKNWHGLGNTALYGEYGRFERGADGVITTAAPIGDTFWDTEVSFWGIGVVQNIDAAAMELFLSYRQYQLDFQTGPGIGFATPGGDDLSIIMSGARIRF